YLGYRQEPQGPSWCLLAFDSDNPGPFAAACTRTALTTSVLNTWVHLVGVYDASSGHLALYVDGTRVDDGSAVRHRRWKASGPFAVGRAWWTPSGGTPGESDAWIGAIDDVTVYAGVVPATEIPSLK